MFGSHSSGVGNISEIVDIEGDGYSERENGDQIVQEFSEIEEEALLRGNHFWARGYCVSTIGIDEGKVRKYVKYQEEREKREEREQEQFDLF